MKFKAGDRVKIIGDCRLGIPSDIWKKLKGTTHIVTSVRSHSCELDGGYGFSYHSDMLEPAPFGKSDLKTGMRVFTREGNQYIVIKDNIFGQDVIVRINEIGFGLLDNYKEGLDEIKYADLDIVAVYEPVFAVGMVGEFDERKFTLVWKRDETPVEVTIAEIAALKGVSPEQIRIKEED